MHWWQVLALRGQADLYTRLLHRSAKSDTDEESIKKATLSPLESGNEEEEEDDFNTEGVEDDAVDVDDQQEAQPLLEHAEMPSPTTSGRSKGYLLRT